MRRPSLSRHFLNHTPDPPRDMQCAGRCRSSALRKTKIQTQSAIHLIAARAAPRRNSRTPAPPLPSLSLVTTQRARSTTSKTKEVRDLAFPYEILENRYHNLIFVIRKGVGEFGVTAPRNMMGCLFNLIRPLPFALHLSESTGGLTAVIPDLAHPLRRYIPPWVNHLHFPALPCPALPCLFALLGCLLRHGARGAGRGSGQCLSRSCTLDRKPFRIMDMDIISYYY